MSRQKTAEKNRKSAPENGEGVTEKKSSKRAVLMPRKVTTLIWVHPE
jgi:hypothetical protein